MAHEKRYLSNKESADLIGMSESYLNQDRYLAKASGATPRFPFIRIGRTIKYDRDILAQIMAQSLVD